MCLGVAWRWVEGGSAGHEECWTFHQPAVWAEQTFALFSLVPRRGATEPCGDDGWSHCSLVTLMLCEASQLYVCFFSEMRSCLHPACAGGQPRCLGTVITQKVISRARIETCTPPWPLSGHPTSHHVLSQQRERVLERESVSAENGKLVVWAIPCPHPQNQSWIPSLFEDD